MVEHKSRITGVVEEWWKSVCQKHNCKYYIHQDYPLCSYCTCPDNCIVTNKRECKAESEEVGMTREQQYWEDTQEALSRIYDRYEEIDPQNDYDMLKDIHFVRGFINKHKPQERSGEDE